VHGPALLHPEGLCDRLAGRNLSSQLACGCDRPSADAGPLWQAPAPFDQPTPRSLKSRCVSVTYIAWLLGHDPTRHVIVASYSGDFAAELHWQFRMVVASEWYAAVFPHLHLAKETALELVIRFPVD
jgi:hypothetical protein